MKQRERTAQSALEREDKFVLVRSTVLRVASDVKLSVSLSP